MKVGIIGAGIGGLSIALRQVLKGNEVIVFEKNKHAGGKISQIKKEGYRFDTGPSLFTLPHLIDELLLMAGKDPQTVLPYKKLDINCKYFFSDGTDFNFYADADKLREELKNKTTENPEHVFNRLLKSENIYELSSPVFIFSNFHKISNYNTPPYRNIALKLYKLDFFRTMHTANHKDFSDKNMVQLFDRYATYNGSNPYKAPATLNMISHLENNIGSFFPEKGMYNIVDSLYRLCIEKGVEFRFNTKVEEILVTDNEAYGIRTTEEIIPFDIIVSDSDVRYVTDNLLKESLFKKILHRMENSSSALIFYWGINKQHPSLELHNILFSQDYKQEFKDLFTNKTIYADPTVYIFISSKIVKSDAPQGGENWFVMINAPADNGQKWEKLIEQTRRNIIKKINKSLNTDIESHIVCEEIISPLSIEKKTFSVSGALYGTSSNSMFSAFLRHPNMLKKIKNLYFVGGSVHPGGGIPLCLASSQIVDNEINNND